MKRSLEILLLVLLALSVQANNLVNGNFEGGVSGFSSDYVNFDLRDAKQFTVATSDPQGWAPGFTDHTTGSGNMLILNGATDISRFWYCKRRLKSAAGGGAVEKCNTQ